MRPVRVKRLVAAFVGDPATSKNALYGSKTDAPRLPPDWCLLPGLNLLAALNVVLSGGYSLEADVPSGITLLQPDGPLNIPSPVTRYLYAVSEDLCERLAALTDSRIEEISTNWYRLEYPFLGPDELPVSSAGKSLHRGKVLGSLTRLARMATERHQRLLLYVEHRRQEE